MNLATAENKLTNNNSDVDPIILSENAEKRILEIKSKAENKNKYLRILVSGGGCSGFQYNFNLDDQINDDDFRLVKNDQILVAIDLVSLDFLRHCVIDYVQDLGGAFFKINNPNAKVSCGCGSSFSV